MSDEKIVNGEKILNYLKMTKHEKILKYLKEQTESKTVEQISEALNINKNTVVGVVNHSCISKTGIKRSKPAHFVFDSDVKIE